MVHILDLEPLADQAAAAMGELVAAQLMVVQEVQILAVAAVVLLVILGNRAAGSGSSGTDVLIGGQQSRTTGNVLRVDQGSDTYLTIDSTGNALFNTSSSNPGNGNTDTGVSILSSGRVHISANTNNSVTIRARVVQTLQ